MSRRDRQLPTSARGKAMAKARKDPRDGQWAWIKEKKDLALTLRRPFERQWVLNLAFLRGQQLVGFNAVSHSLIFVKSRTKEKKVIDNQLMPMWRRQVTDLIKTEPVMSVVPATNDEEDIKAAKIGDKVLKCFWRREGFQKKIRQLAGWIHGTGNAFLADRWARDKGPMVMEPKSGKFVYEGDVECTVWTPFEMLIPAWGMGTYGIHDLPWIGMEKWVPLDDIVWKYKRGKEVVAESIGENVFNISHILGEGRGGFTSELPGAFLIDFYVKPCTEFPKGKFFVAANGVVLEEMDYPFSYFPVEHFKDVDLPGVFWGFATMDSGIGLQTAWNRALSSLDQYNRVMAKGKWLVPRKAKMAVAPDDGHGEIISYDPVMGGLKPEHLNLKGLPSTIDRQLNYLLMSMQKLFSQPEVTQGTNKSDIRSGEMVDILLEQAAHGKIPTHAIFEESMEAVMGRVLRRIKQGYKSKRLLQIAGQEGEFDLISFQGSDLRDNTDVIIKKQSSIPESRVARQNMVLRKAEMGLYGPLADGDVRRHVMNMLEDAVVTDIYSDTRLDESVARWENRQIVEGRGKPFVINSYDNHALHIKEHNHFRKKKKYQELKVKSPVAFMTLETGFMRHIMDHQKFLDQQMQKALQQQAILQGKGK